MKYVCDVCGYIYDEAAGDPDNGIAPGTKWEDVPEDFLCPLCGVGKDQFSKIDQLKKLQRAAAVRNAAAFCYLCCKLQFDELSPLRQLR